MKYFFAALLFFFFQQVSFTQVSVSKGIALDDSLRMKQLEDTLVILSFAMVNDSTPVNRFASCQEFIKTFVKALKIENSFQFPFERVRTVSIQYPPDSSFRIFTWQVYVDINEYHYYGTIQMNQPKLKMFPLIDRSENVTDPEMEILKPDQWYGSLYYRIKPFEKEGQTHYLLFGFDAYRFFDKRKLVDVLTFENGEPRFGLPVFEIIENEIPRMVNRFLLEYSSDARVKLNYDDELGMIVFDHLIPMGSPYKEGAMTFVPDGDIDGFFLENGIWKFKPRVFDQVLDQPPRPVPVFDQKKKDLFGQ